MDALSAFTDLHGLAELRTRVRQDASAAAVSEVAAQFASVFTHMMLKSMRQASLGEGLFDSEQSLFYRDLFDQELAVTLSTQDHTGIAHLIETQLSGLSGLSGIDPDSAGEHPHRPVDAAGQYQKVQTMTSEQKPAGAGPGAESQGSGADADTVDSLSRNWMERVRAR